jgi:uncharacterized SAM-binding protein YcdF (DUF218 family)
MAFWHVKKNWEDDYDDYYAQDRRLGSDGKPRKNGLRFFAHGLTLLFAGTLFLAAVGMVNGQTMVEKMVTELAMPIGIVWLALLALVYFCLLTKQAWPAVVGFFCWLILTLAGNFFVSNWLVATLEQPYQSIDVFKMEPLDTLVVLGGGTNSRLTGGSQLSGCGDRVATAARLFHAHQVKNIICTGSDPFPASALDLNPRDEATQVLIGLGVPPANITQLKGHNTSEELLNLRSLIDSNSGLGKIGILTSAWHLPRAIRLAQANGLELIPVPSDFLTEPIHPTPNLIVPNAYRSDITARSLKELLAGLIGR